MSPGLRLRDIRTRICSCAQWLQACPHGGNIFLMPPWRHTCDKLRPDSSPQESEHTTKVRTTPPHSILVFFPSYLMDSVIACLYLCHVQLLSGFKPLPDAVPFLGLLKALIRGEPLLRVFWGSSSFQSWNGSPAFFAWLLSSVWAGKGFLSYSLSVLCCIRFFFFVPVHLSPLLARFNGVPCAASAEARTRR